jgi:putative ABC transport system permease protein
MSYDLMERDGRCTLGNLRRNYAWGIFLQNLIKLNLADAVFALGLIAIAIGLSAVAKLGLELNLALATGRTILQLVVLGYVLDFIFGIDSAWTALGILTIMLTITAIVARNRIGQKIPQLFGLVWGAIFLSTSVTLLYAEFLIIHPDKWDEARYLVPLGSILVGTSLNAAVITGERLIVMVKQCIGEIETHLSLGATPQQAISIYQRDSIRSGLIPLLNQMMLVGLVTIPSFTSGQLLAGVNPLDAISYEILVMLMVVVANLITTILVTKGLCRYLFNSAGQLLIDDW